MVAKGDSVGVTRKDSRSVSVSIPGRVIVRTRQC